MIARIQTRTSPIPFEAPAATGASSGSPRAINWSGSGNPGTPRQAATEAACGPKVRLAGHLPLSAQCGVQGAAAGGVQNGALHTQPVSLGMQAANMPRLSPVKVALPFGSPLASAPAATSATSSVSLPTCRPAATTKARVSSGHRALTDITARYTGQGSLSVRSSVTGRHYRFQGHGDCLVIDKNDVALLRRIADLDIC